ncbi:MAG: 3-deoxy-D-manno-octulosonic acid transferase [Bdellovibrionota bacterium]
MDKVFLVLYDITTFFLSFILIPFFLCRKRGRKKILERFGFWNIEKGDYVWFHGASLGEIKGILPVIKKYKEKNKGVKVLLTATSVSGLDIGKDVASECRLLPFDCTLFYKLISRKFNAKKIIITETEIWPIFIKYFSKKGVELYLINARISDMTIKKYRKFSFVITPLLNSFKKILVQTNKDYEYFKTLAVDDKKLLVAGNSKYETTLKVKSPFEALEIFKKYFPDEKINKVITLASIRPKEEAFLFPTLKTLLDNNEDVGLIVAPRHKEKFSYFENKLKEYGFNFVNWTENKGGKRGANVVFLDTYGELDKTFSFSKLVFIGGSIENIGGHNPLEAFVYGAYVFLGEHYQNYEEIINNLLVHEYVSIVRKEEDLDAILVVLLNVPELLKEKGQKAMQYARSLCGATDIILKEIS